MLKLLREFFTRARTFWSRELWTAEPDPGSLPGRALGVLRFVVMVSEGFVRHHLLLPSCWMQT